MYKYLLFDADNTLLDFNKGEYQNAYYLFSKVSFISPLKPIAIYHQGECARLLNDKDSAIKQFSFLYNNYLQSPLNLRAKYLAAEQLIEKDPIKAEKIFKSIIKKNPENKYVMICSKISNFKFMNEIFGNYVIDQFLLKYSK